MDIVVTRNACRYRIEFSRLALWCVIFIVLHSFSCPDIFAESSNAEKTVAPAKTRRAGRKKNADTSKTDKNTSKEESAANDPLFLPEPAETQKWIPEIFRCPDCGYEQDEPGFCPDHQTIELIRVLSRGTNPLEPPELDGNEDIIVDIPLTGISFGKQPVVQGNEPAAAKTPSKIEPPVKK